MSAQSPAPDFATIKQRQQATWATGDYSIIGTTLQIVGERLCEAVELRARWVRPIEGRSVQAVGRAQGRNLPDTVGSLQESKRPD